jgi:2-polyprenyl-3-methyl-5-hydroxy-6-metoxy-1,4-benzoquinol methylase
VTVTSGAERSVVVSAEDIARIRAVSHLQRSSYRDLDIAATLDFFRNRYLRPLARIHPLADATLVDCASGYGWLAIGFLLAGGRSAIAVDMDAERLDAARRIAEIFGVAERMELLCSPMQSIPLEVDAADFFVSVETLEHVGRENVRPALERMRDIARRAVLLTTPNKLFPAVAHDTRLPFLHWLPPKRRGRVARLFGREELDAGSEFLSPFDLRILLEKFRPVSRCVTFEDFAEYRRQFPFYQPYGPDDSKRRIGRPSLAKATYYRAASELLGSRSYWVMPTLTTLMARRSTP